MFLSFCIFLNFSALGFDFPSPLPSLNSFGAIVMVTMMSSFSSSDFLFSGSTGQEILTLSTNSPFLSSGNLEVFTFINVGSIDLISSLSTMIFIPLKINFLKDLPAHNLKFSIKSEGFPSCLSCLLQIIIVPDFFPASFSNSDGGSFLSASGISFLFLFSGLISTFV